MNNEKEQVEISSFDEANDKAREMVENPTQEEETPVTQEEEQPQEEPTESTSQVDPLALAEKATEEMARSKEETEKIRTENEHLKKLLSEINAEREKEVEEDAFPEFSMDGLTFMDPQEQKQAFSDFAKQIAEYSRRSTLKAISPLIERSQSAIQSQEEQSIFDELRGTEEFKDIDEFTPKIRQIMENNTVLKNGDFTPEERIATAYLIAQGVENHNRKQQPDTTMSKDVFLKMIDDNPEYSEYLNERNLERAKQNSNLPRFSATGGAGNSALNMKEMPKTFSEAADFIKKHYK